MRLREFIACFGLGLALTLLSSGVHNRVTMTYPDIMGCERGCQLEGVGIPLTYIADYPGLSPVNSADFMGAVLGLDRVLWPSAFADFAFWTALSTALLWILVRARRRDRE